ncbi:hypothetical protein [Vibrio splendidus]|uniref:hypothetical protein n=1 Tax=Vibrio splendidus TaxID=29497 RepID=UPI00148BD788|nr:hypothetical protein [Vibrio splendidus]NOJ08300.1 hypothetical protein [Vibrio splendidus]
MKLPEYLEFAEVIKCQAPTVDKPDRLPFNLMDPKMFECFCCDLIDYMMSYKLRRSIFKVLPIGTIGQKQYGADIFVENIEGARTTYSLYEVKRVKNYNFSEYKRTVARFLKNHESWGIPIDKFTLLVAEDISAESIALWKREAQKLSELKIEYEVVSISELNKWVRDFPELAFKYFHESWVESFWGEAALWHIKKYGIFRFEESASWVGYKDIEKEIYEDFFSYKNDHVRIQGFLPSRGKNNLSCFVEFRNGKFSHVMITLNEQQLLERYFVGCEIPQGEFEHPYLIKNSIGEGDSFFCDIGNSRVLISSEEAFAFQDAMQLFKNEYVSRILKIEEVWRSSRFITYEYKGNDIPLLSIKRSLWGAIKSFARENDAFETDGVWSVFDSGSDWLKIYTKTTNKKMEMGYHAFIKPRAKVSFHSNFTMPDNDVILVWSPPGELLVNDFDGDMGPRYYWDAKTSHDWLVNELIPCVLKWAHEPQTRSRQSLVQRTLSRLSNLGSKPNNSEYDPGAYNPEFYLDSFCRQDISKQLDTASSLEDMLGAINELQHFFACTNRLYIDLKSYRVLYLNLAELLSRTDMNERGFGYVRSNLNYLDAKDYQDLIRLLREHAYEAQTGCTNTFKLDCLLRCYQSCLRDEKCHLNEVEVNSILSELKPVFKLMNERSLLERQLDRLE